MLYRRARRLILDLLDGALPGPVQRRLQEFGAGPNGADEFAGVEVVKTQFGSFVDETAGALEFPFRQVSRRGDQVLESFVFWPRP